MSSLLLLEIGSSLQCRDITNGNSALTDGAVSAPKARDELINLDNGEILLQKQCSGSSVAVIIILRRSTLLVQLAALRWYSSDEKVYLLSQPISDAEEIRAG